jgi:hypothetical protein
MNSYKSPNLFWVICHVSDIVSSVSQSVTCDSVSLRIIFKLPLLEEEDLFIRTPKVTFTSSKATLDGNSLLTLSVYARQTQQSEQLFRPCLSGEFDI